MATVSGDYDHIALMLPETISIIAAGTFLNMIASTLPDLNTDVTFFLDNEATVINSSRTLLHDVGKVVKNGIDITLQNVKLIKNKKFNYSLSHLHGHQNDDIEVSELRPVAIINIDMDNLAGDHVDYLIRKNHNTSEPGISPAQQVGILVNGKRVSTYIEGSLVFGYYKDDLEKIYNNVVHLDKQQFKNVRWNSLRLPLRDSSKIDQITKAIHSQWQTKHICKKWKLTDDANCPLCKCENETWDHVLKCTNVHMTRV